MKKLNARLATSEQIITPCYKKKKSYLFIHLKLNNLVNHFQYENKRAIVFSNENFPNENFLYKIQRNRNFAYENF